MFALPHRVAVISGAASGIGAATAILFAEQGADLVLSRYPRDPHDISLVERAALEFGHRVITMDIDVRDPAQTDAMVARAVDEFGSVDIVVANAAIARLHESAELGDDDWNDTLDVNLTGAFRLFRAAIPHMQKAQYGRLLATTSTAGPIEGWAAHAHYSAAKTGIIGMVHSLAAELGPDGITVNAVAPGIIETPQTLDAVNSLGEDGVALTAERQPVRRVGVPLDIAKAFLYLGSEDASFVTGQVLIVDGGRTLMHG